MGRIFANTAWLLGGKGFGALCSLVYLVILTRTLGLKDFGHFSLIFGTAQALIAVAGFQTWQIVVRYGAPHVHHKDWAKFGRLGMLCGVIDMIGAIVGCLIAYVVIYGFADTLDLNPAFLDMAFAFCCAMLWALVSAPTGIVRALDRFDMAVYVEAVVPIGRLLAALAIWWTGPTVGRFLLAWALIDILEAVCYWAMARKLCPQAVKLSHLKNWRLALEENDGVGRFFMATYTSSVLGAVTRYGPLLAVGGLVGTKAAGLYRLASQLTQSMSKLSTLLTRAVYAEVARASATSEAAEFRKLTVQTSKIAGITGAIVVALALVAGKLLLALVGGEDFEEGAVVLVPLAIAASFELASVAFEPVLHSTGRVRLALVARVLSIVALGISISVLQVDGAVGVAWSVAIAGTVVYAVMGVMAFATLRRIDQNHAAANTLDEGSTAK